jgi:hypothetical protein
MSYSAGANPNYIDFYPQYNSDYSSSPASSSSYVPIVETVQKGWSITYSHNYQESSHYGASPSSISSSDYAPVRASAEKYFG